MIVRYKYDRMSNDLHFMCKIKQMKKLMKLSTCVSYTRCFEIKMSKHLQVISGKLVQER